MSIHCECFSFLYHFFNKSPKNLLIRFVFFTLAAARYTNSTFYSMQKLCTGIVACIWCNLGEKKDQLPDSNSADFILRVMLKVFKSECRGMSVICHLIISSMWCTATLHLHDFPNVWFSVVLWHCQCLSLTCYTEDNTAPKGKEWLLFSSLVSKNGFPSQTNGSLSETEREMQQRIWEMQKSWNADLCHFEVFSLLLELSVFWWWEDGEHGVL